MFRRTSVSPFAAFISAVAILPITPMDLALLSSKVPDAGGQYRPVGNTDSEQAFCHLLGSLKLRYPDGQPPLAELYGSIAAWSAETAKHGKFNYILSNGDYLFAHCTDNLSYVLRHAPFTTAHLKDQDIEMDFSQVTTPNDRIAIVATEPLTDNERWVPFSSGQLVVFQNGAPLSL